MTISTLAKELNVAPFRIIKFMMNHGQFLRITQHIPKYWANIVRRESEKWPKKGSLDMGVNRCKEYL